MEDSTKLSLTLIILAGIWFLAQPISGNISISGNVNNISYFNMTNSTISGNVQILGNMPIGMILPMFFVEIYSDIPDDIKTIFYLFILVVLLLSFAFVLFALRTILEIYRKNKKYTGENHE